MIRVFIPVRGGSKSIPKKNIKVFCGKPLVYWNIDAALHTEGIDRVVVATDDEEMVRYVEGLREEKIEVYRRSEASASDTASTEMVLLEYIETQNIPESDTILLMQATSPFTRSADLARGLEVFRDGHDSVLSVVPFKRFLWEDEEQGARAQNYNVNHRPRRQDMKASYMENGAFYIQSVQGIKHFQSRLGGNIGLVEMAEHTGLEIDEPLDWERAEALFRRHEADRCVAIKTGNIRLVLSDVDGVLTDAGMYYSADGDIMKKFNTHDGMGFNLLQQSGIKVGIITSEDTQIVAKRAEKLRLDFVCQGHRFGGKLEAAKGICAELGIGLEQVAYIGDDINCKPLLEAVGFAACPADAMAEIKNIVGIHILEKRGGEGCFRELADRVLVSGVR
jgi:YrbI family 3-deoxy-D-manno-octulosonate 8-phosphate phosphatase